MVENCQKWFMILLISLTYPGLEITIFKTSKVPRFSMTVRTLSVPHFSSSSQSWQNILYLWPLCLFVCVSLFVWAVRVEMGPPSVSTGSLQQGCCHLVSQASICGALCRSDIWAWVEEVFQGRWGDISYTLCSLSLSLSFWHLLGRQSLSQKSQLPISVSPGPRQTGFGGLWFDRGPWLLTNQLAPTVKVFLHSDFSFPLLIAFWSYFLGW